MLDAVAITEESDKLKILLIEDQQVFRQIALQCLTNLGSFDKFVAKTAKSGLQQFKEELPDITFLDIRLPDGNGLELLQKFRQIHPKSYVAMMTSSTDKTDYERARQLGAAGFVRKPFSHDAVKRQLNYYREWVSRSKKTAKSPNTLNALTDGYKLLRQRLDTKVVPYLDDVQDELRKELKGIIKYVAEMAGDNVLEPVDMNLVLEKTLALLQAKIVARNATITVGGLPVVQSKVVEMETVFNGIIDYALKTESTDIDVYYIEKQDQCTFIISLSHLNKAVELSDPDLRKVSKTVTALQGKLAVVDNTVRLYWQREDLF